MFRPAHLFLLATLLLSPIATTYACDWDRETNSREVQFKRYYETSSSANEDLREDLLGYLPLASGSLLSAVSIGAAIIVGIRLTRNPA